MLLQYMRSIPNSLHKYQRHDSKFDANGVFNIDVDVQQEQGIIKSINSDLFGEKRGG